MNGNLNRLPKYAVDLLIAAKSVTTPAVNASPGMLDDSLQQLGAAIHTFEAAMPLVDGVIQEGASQTQFQALGAMLAEYRAGTRAFPTYAELAALVGNDHDGHAAINAVAQPTDARAQASLAAVRSDVAGMLNNSDEADPRYNEGFNNAVLGAIGCIEAAAAAAKPSVDQAEQAARHLLETAASLCDQQAAEWDSDGVVSNKNYAAHCAALIRAMGGRQ